MQVGPKPASLEGHASPLARPSEDVVVVKAGPGVSKRKRVVKKDGSDDKEDQSSHKGSNKEEGTSLDDIASFLARR